MNDSRGPEKGARAMGYMGNRRMKRLTATVLTLLTAVLLTACGSAAPASPAYPAAESVAEAGPAEIQAVELRAGEAGTYLEIGADAPLMWTSFRDPEGRLVIELPNTVAAGSIADLYPDAGLVSAVRVESPERDGGPLTRLLVATRRSVEHSVSGEGQRLEIELIPTGGPLDENTVEVASQPLPPADEVAFEPLPAEEPAVSDPPVVRESFSSEEIAEADVADEPYGAPDPPVRAAAYPSDPGTPEDPFVGPPPTGEPARTVDDVAVDTTDHGTVVRVRGDGQFDYSTFALDNPHRFVIDLAGVVNRDAPPNVAVGGMVQRVRVGQFRSSPDPVSRVVFDLETPIVPRIERTADTLVVDFGELNGNSPVTRPAAVAAMPASDPYPAPEPAPPEPEAQQPTQIEITNEPDEPGDDDAEIQVRAEDDVEMEAAPVDDFQVEEPVRRTPPPAVEQAYEPQDLYGREEVEISTPGMEPTEDPFRSRTLAGDEREYVGERLDFSLRDADLVETLRSFAVMSDFNIVIQPGVQGTVTVQLEDVPWDQAFEQILKINNLSYEIEGNIMRIAPVGVLAAEAQQRQQLEQAKALSIPLTTVIRRLSYSQANNVAGILSSAGGILSQRGTVIVDQRTNTLIIKELPNYIDTVISVIENLDIPEPLVMIEARIVETRKNFTRTLGVEWGFGGVAGPEFGNDTGLVFPNQGTVDGGVNLLTGGNNGFIDLALGNVLNTFNLDATLQAAENDGLVNILSAPKVQALNNQQASIQSGVQIPIQTVANNTVSVQFVNATLRLDVTPQVTAEGTVMMDINIQKRNPEFGLTVAGATNAPISTKEARTRVIVRDGGTTVIGGIYEVTTNQGEDRVPGLANVPIIGHLFKNRRRSDENSELLIFITPRVIKL